jgi:polysaccharide pyruvyl transferase WcaK-like protein
MRISILGWYGKKNVGDEAFRSVLPGFFPGHDIEFVTPPNRCNSPDIVVLGGGAVVSPFYMDVLPDCPRYALGVDISFDSEIDLLEKHGFRGVCVRNNTDIETMRSRLSCRVEPMPDLAFDLTPHPDPVLARYKRAAKPTLAVFATDYVNPAIDRPYKVAGARAQSFKEGMARELDAVSGEYEVVLVPCATGGYGDDRRINLDIKAYMEHEPTLVMDTLTPEETVRLIGEADVTLCQRFHSHIFSVVARTPLLSLKFTRKVDLFLKEHGLADRTVGEFKTGEFLLKPLAHEIAAGLALELPRRFDALSADYKRRLQDLKVLVRQEWLR